MFYVKDYYTYANVLLSHVIAYLSKPENGKNVQKKKINIIRSLVFSVCLGIMFKCMLRVKKKQAF